MTCFLCGEETEFVPGVMRYHHGPEQYRLVHEECAGRLRDGQAWVFDTTRARDDPLYAVMRAVRG